MFFYFKLDDSVFETDDLIPVFRNNLVYMSKWILQRTQFFDLNKVLLTYLVANDIVAIASLFMARSNGVMFYLFLTGCLHNSLHCAILIHKQSPWCINQLSADYILLLVTNRCDAIMFWLDGNENALESLFNNSTLVYELLSFTCAHGSAVLFSYFHEKYKDIITTGSLTQIFKNGVLANSILNVMFLVTTYPEMFYAFVENNTIVRSSIFMKKVSINGHCSSCLDPCMMVSSCGHHICERCANISDVCLMCDKPINKLFSA